MPSRLILAYCSVMRSLDRHFYGVGDCSSEGVGYGADGSGYAADGSCIDNGDGTSVRFYCMGPGACHFCATVEDTLSCLSQCGCTDQGATNYDTDATVDDGSCVFDCVDDGFTPECGSTDMCSGESDGHCRRLFSSLLPPSLPRLTQARLHRLRLSRRRRKLR